MIVIIDYTVGNIKRVCNSFHHIDCDVKLSCKRKDIETATGIVLLGVTTFGYAIKALGSAAQFIKEEALARKPILCICVGYQIFSNLTIYKVR